MKIKSILAATILGLGIVFSLAGCNSSENRSSESSEMPKSAIESLSDEEKQIFDALIIASDTFYVPESIRVYSVKDAYSKPIEIDGEPVGGDHYGPKCLIELSADSRAGISEKSEYILWTSDWGDKKYDTIAGFSWVEMRLYHKNGTIIEYDPLDHDASMAVQHVTEFENVEVGNLNRALKEYWDEYFESLGIS